MRSETLALLAFVASAAALGPRPARAQTPTETRLREALRSATAQLRTAEDERAHLQAAEAALNEEIASLRRQLASPSPMPRAASVRELGDLRRDLAEAKRRLDEQSRVNRVAAESLAQCQTEGQQAVRVEEGLRAEIAVWKKRVAAASDRNARMYQVGREIIDWLSTKGIATALWTREPFLGIKRVQLENAAEGYRDKLEEQRLGAGGKQ
jgi:chromosome segregation ATPase